MSPGAPDGRRQDGIPEAGNLESERTAPWLPRTRTTAGRLAIRDQARASLREAKRISALERERLELPARLLLDDVVDEWFASGARLRRACRHWPGTRPSAVSLWFARHIGLPIGMCRRCSLATFLLAARECAGRCDICGQPSDDLRRYVANQGQSVLVGRVCAGCMYGAEP